MTESDHADPAATRAAVDYAGPDPSRPGRLDRLFLRPLGWPTTALAAVAAGLTLCIDSGAVGGLTAVAAAVVLVACVVAWIGAIVTWAIRLAGHALVLSRFRRATELKRTVWRWVPAPLLLAVTVALCKANVPESALSRLCRPTMESAARAALANPPGRRVAVLAGGFGTAYAEVVGPAVYFIVPGLLSYAGDGPLSRQGFVYSPTQVSAGHGGYNVVGDGWYRWHQTY